MTFDVARTMQQNPTRWCPILIGAAVLACPVLAEDAKKEAEIAAGHSYHGEAFNEGPRQAAVLIPGMAELEFPVTSKSETAKQFVRQGIAQLHGFWFLEAERSFRQAAKEDPELAIAYWGMAMANANNIKRARGFIDQAMSRRNKNTGRHEKLYVEALNRLIPKVEDDDKEKSEKKDSEAEKEAKKKRSERYVADLEKILHEFPDDNEAKAFIAVHLWKADRYGVKLTSRYAVNALMEDILEDNPLHPVHHYRIHLWDGARPANALESAAKCGPASPGIAHMWHMPGHIYSKLKRYSDAAWQQEASARVDHAHMNRARLIPDQIHNYAHNNEWLTRNLLFVGRVNDALDQARNLVSLPRHPKYNSLEKGGSYKYGRTRLLQTLTQYGLWEELRNEAGGHYLPPTGDKQKQEEWLSWLAVARFMTGEQEEAGRTMRSLRRRRIKLRLELLDLADGRESDTEEESSPSSEEDIKKRIAELDKTIARGAAASASVRKDLEAFKKHAKKAKLDRVLEAQWLADAGDVAGGIKLAQRAVSEGKGRVRPLAVLVNLLWRDGKKDEAKKQFAELRTLAGTADIDTPLLAKLSPIAKAAKAPTDWRTPAEPAKDLGERPDLDELGPFRWQPYVAPSWEAREADNELVASPEYAGRPRLLIFYLGFGCLHCVEQLHAFSPKLKEFRDAGIEVVGISTESVEELANAQENFDKKMSIPLFADGKHVAFKSFRCWDDFENQPLHGTFLIDAQDRVRWQDIGHEPFNDADFVLEEAKRLLALP